MSILDEETEDRRKYAMAYIHQLVNSSRQDSNPGGLTLEVVNSASYLSANN